jgi:hypothetical protein
MYLWMPMVAWGVVKLACALIQWRARIGYERARASAVVGVLRSAHAGVTLWDRHADGTMLCIGARPVTNCGTAARETCRGSVAEQR